MIPNDCRGKGKGETIRGPVGPRTPFKCCLQVVLVVSKILSCVRNGGITQMRPTLNQPDMLSRLVASAVAFLRFSASQLSQPA